MSENLFPKPVTVHRLTFRVRALHLSLVVIHRYGKLAPRWWIKGQVRWEFVLYLCGVRKWPKWLTLILSTSWRSACFLFSPRHLKNLYWYFYYSRRGNWKRLAPSAGLRLCFVCMHGPYSVYHVAQLACWWDWGGDKKNFEITILYSRS